MNRGLQALVRTMAALGLMAEATAPAISRLGQVIRRTNFAIKKVHDIHALSGKPWLRRGRKRRQ